MNSKNLASTAKGISHGTAIRIPQKDCISPNRISKKLLTKSKNKSEYKGINNKMISKTKSIKKPQGKSKNKGEVDETNPRKENVVPNNSISKSPNRMKSKSPIKKSKSPFKVHVEIKKEETSKNGAESQVSKQDMNPLPVVLEQNENSNLKAEQKPADIIPVSDPKPAETKDFPSQAEVASNQNEVVPSGQLPSPIATIPVQAAMEKQEVKEIEPIPEEKSNPEELKNQPMNAPIEQDVEMKDVTMSEIKPNPESNKKDQENQEEKVPKPEEPKSSEAPISEDPKDKAPVSESNPDNVPSKPVETTKNEGDQAEKKEEGKEQKSDAMMFT